ncbi:MAG: DUF2867 domain-containing protein [Candidatus Eisenbacteria bacterium]|nr:DUF2867 domain-containing protein [Candidatus Eisenbacteria bacterium]
MKILVTGATGYIGGRLVPRLLELGHAVRVLVRDPARIAGRSWAVRVEIATGDLVTGEGLESALSGIDVAYYLVHSMYGGTDFAARDAGAARRFAAAGSALRLTIYLGGLVPRADDISAHLASRAEVGAILRAEIPTTELRAGPIIGSGSSSFEMVRYLTERLPAMIAPRWIRNPVQPIAVRDAMEYLIAALDRPALGVVEIGADPLPFMDMMHGYAAVRGLRRIILPVRVLAPTLAARWVGLVTPIPNALAVPLIAGVVHPVLADRAAARAHFPGIVPISYRDAVVLALGRTEHGAIETRWSDALGDAPACNPTTFATYAQSDWEGVIREVRTRRVATRPDQVFRAFAGLGGARGWLVWNWAWNLRGLLDRVVGGPGLRRGRRDADELLVGDAVDFWRVEAVVPGRLLRLRAEMRVPGEAWLQWEAIDEGDSTRLVQVFSDLVDAVARVALKQDGRRAA